ncbi:ABC transporter ATP-binding protein [Patulibacter sp. S7RM1-6]
MLELHDLHVRYGTVPAVRGVDLRVEPGALVAMLGANGAGKSSTLNAATGVLRPAAGRVVFDGVDVTGWPVHRVARRGLALVPEGRMVVGSLTVLENLRLSAYARGRRRADLEGVLELFPRLAERRHQLAASMSGGEQQMLAIARAVMTAPKLLVLDEPSMGLSPAMVDVVFSAISAIHASGIGVLLVEQNAAVALPLADRALVLDRGSVASAGTPEELEADPATLARHLGLDPDVVPAGVGA